ncbi:MAG: hypothetical protein ACREV7_12625 [Steroidobacteraceae bacterium]
MEHSIHQRGIARARNMQATLGAPEAATPELALAPAPAAHGNAFC